MRASRAVTLLLVLAAVAAAAVVAGCGGGGGGSSVDVGPAAAVPQHAAVYLDATVRPTGTAQQNANAALSKVLDTNDPGAKIVALLNKSVTHIKKGETFTYQQDIAPWLGQKVGLFANSLGPGQDPTVVLESTNNAAAMASERKDSRDLGPGGSYKGHPYDKEIGGKVFGTADGFAIYGPLDGFQAAVDAIDGDSLGDSSDFKNALGDLPADRLGTFYALPKDFLAALGPGQFDPQSRATFEKLAGDSLDKPVAGSLTATPNSFDLQFTGGNSGLETPESSLLASAPAQSWVALGIGNLGNVIKQEIDQLKNANIPNLEAGLSQVQQATGASVDQLTAALGDAVIYVQGTTKSTLSGAMVIQTKNPDLTGRLLSQLQTLLGFGGGAVKPLRLSGGATGFQARFPGLPLPIELVQQGDKLVLGYGAGSAGRSLAPTQTLADSASFSQATGQVSDLGTDFFLDFPSVFKLAEATGANSDPGYRQAKRYISALSYLVSGSGTKGDKTEVKAVLGLK